MQRKVELSGERGDKGLVLVGFRAADAVVQVRDGEYEAKSIALFQQGAKQSDRVGAARAGDTNLHPGVE